MQNDEKLRQVIDAVANALQPAALLATRLRRDIGQDTKTAIELEAAIDRAVRALRNIQPTRDGR
jgi:hypothetical protein